MVWVLVELVEEIEVMLEDEAPAAAVVVAPAAVAPSLPVALIRCRAVVAAAVNGELGSLR